MKREAFGTQRFVRNLAAVLMLQLVLVGVGPGQETRSLHEKISRELAGLTTESSPGLAVLVRIDGKTVFERSYGLRDLRTRTRIDAYTNFRLASFTKQFTAMSIMLLVHDGKLRYDDTLTRIFPDFPAYGQAITIRHLLAHTSGLPDYEDLMSAAEKSKSPVWSADRQIQDKEVLGLLRQQTKGKFAPGTSWAYSNSGYVLLGLIVAKASGKPFGQFLQERIFATLKMNHTLLYEKGKNEVPNRAYGHSKEADGWKETDQSPTSATQGDGGIYSNLADLALWDDALCNHTFLSEAEMQPALTPIKLADGSKPHWPLEPSGDNLHPGKPVSYGFGWFLDPYQGHARMYHDGDTLGFRTTIQRFPESNLTIIILCNRSDLDPEKLSLQVAGIFLSEKNQPCLQERPESLPSPFIFARAAIAPYCFIIWRIWRYCFST